MRMLGTLLIGIGLGYGLLALMLFVFQSRFIYFPAMGREDALTPAALQLPFDELRITTADGEMLHGWFIPALGARATVLFFHGNAGSIAHRVDWLPMFQQLQLSALLFDYRGYGSSTGTPTEAGTYTDAEAAWRYLTEARNIPASQIALFGESLGGAVAAHLASRQQPAALVLHSSFTSLPDLAAELYPFLPARLLTRFRYDTLANLKAVRCPVLVAHSPQDEIIPIVHGRRLFEAAHEPKDFMELAGSHNTGFIFTRSVWIQAFGAFLDRHLPVAPP